MGLKLLDKKDSENNREYAYRLLRANIMTLDLLPGAVINEGEVSELLNTSRTPIHEAVLKLKEESLVEVYPQSGSRISLIDISILKEGNFMRSVLEPEILQSVAGNVPPAQMERLKGNLEAQREALEGEERIDPFFKLDDQFHRIIYEIADKKKIWEAVKGVCSHYDRVRYVDAIMNRTDLAHIYEEHRRLFHWLLVGIPGGCDVKRFYDGHLGTYKAHFQEIMEKYPEYFKM